MRCRFALLLVGLLSLVGIAPLAAGAAERSPARSTSSATVDSGAVYRLYLAYFDRAPDAGGFWFWMDQLAERGSLAAISQQFAQSPEYVDTYGDLDDAEFLDQAYSAVFDRSPDAGGREFWLERMASGTPRGAVMIAFSDSTEYKVKTGFLSREAIERLYQAVFLRAADAEGLRFWLDRAAAGRSFVEIATDMVGSDEFTTGYGDLNNAAFVEQIFRNVLGRAPDASGGPFWIGRLEEGVPRGALVWEFSASPEFQKASGLYDRLPPAIPARPGTGPPPIVPQPPPTNFLSQAPPGLFPDPDNNCVVSKLETLLQLKTDDVMNLVLRFYYDNTTTCARDFFLATVVADGPARPDWDFVSGDYQLFRSRVFYNVIYEVPVDALDAQSALDIDVVVQAGTSRVEWLGDINLPLPKTIEVQAPVDPVPFAQERVTVPIEATANPAAPNRRLGLHVRASGACSVEGPPSELFTGYTLVGSGTGSFIFELELLLDTSDQGCGVTVRTDDGDPAVSIYFDRAAPLATTFSIAGDATCPEGECLIEITTPALIPWQLQTFNIRAVDGPDFQVFQYGFLVDEETGLPTANFPGEFADGFCLQLKSSYGGLEAQFGSERCFEAVGDVWVELT